MGALTELRRDPLKTALRFVGRVPLAPMPPALKVLALRSIPGGEHGRTIRVEAAKALGKLLEQRPDQAERVFAEAKRQGVQPYLIVGDSHAAAWVQKVGLPVLIVCTGGAARGLGNPNSRSGYTQRIARLRRTIPTVFKFGQVDVEFVLPFRALKDPLVLDGFEAFAQETIALYLDGLERLAPGSTVATIFPPSLGDESWAQGYVNAQIAELHAADVENLAEALRQLPVVDLSERTRRHQRFNAILTEEAHRRGFRVVDDCTDLIRGGIVAEQYVGVGQWRDHHLDAHAMRDHLEGKARELIACR